MPGPTHETAVVNKQGAPIPPGTAIDPVVATQPVCANLPGGSPSTVLAASINNTLGRGRLRVTTGAMGVAFTLRITGAADGGLPTTVRWPLVGNATASGPNDSGGNPIYLTKITKIETVDSMGAPVAPGDTVHIDWVRPGGVIAADGSADAIGIYPGNATAAAAADKWMRVQNGGPSQAKCAGGWEELDDLVAGAAGALRKRAAMGDDAAKSIGQAMEAREDAALGPVDLG